MIRFRMIGALLTIPVVFFWGKLGGNPTDETYFPAGQGYQWVYSRQNFVADEDADSVYFDTVTVRIVSTDTSDGWTAYQLEGGYYLDVGDIITIGDDRVLVFDGADTVPLVPPADFEPRDDVIGYGLGYRDSILTISLYSGGGYVLLVNSTERLKGVGVINQMAELRSPPHYEGYIDRLMYFIKAQDTVWSPQ